MIPQDASKSQRAVSQLLIAKESRRDKSRAQPEISGHGPDGGLRNSAADYHQTSEAISGEGAGVIEPWNVERKKYFIFEMMTKKILLCETWNDQKNTVNRSPF